MRSKYPSLTCNQLSSETRSTEYRYLRELHPSFSDFVLWISDVWKARGRFDNALADYQRAIGADPQNTYAFNAQAWIWATCREANSRDAKKAVESANRACELTNWRDAGCLDTLAAAYAEAKNFPQAVKWQKKALHLGSAFPKENLEKMRQRLKLYQDGKPFHEN
jgi:tetratricopeptide (TPR) repeat protein